MTQKCPTCGRGGKPRSSNQNRYLWSVVYQLIAEHTGHSSEEVHAFMKARFLPRRFIKIGGREELAEKSTTDLTTAEFEEYAMRVRVFASQELGIQVPLPNEAT